MHWTRGGEFKYYSDDWPGYGVLDSAMVETATHMLEKQQVTPIGRNIAD